MDKTQSIQNNWGKKYQPGTFGIEIEYRVPADRQNLKDPDDADEIFEREVDSPEDPKEWEKENPSPSEPDKDDYEWTDDYITNYFRFCKANGHHYDTNPFGVEHELGECPLKEISDEELQILMLNVQRVNVRDYVYDMVVKVKYNFCSYWTTGEDPEQLGSNKLRMFHDREEFAKFDLTKRKSLYYITPDYIQKRIDDIPGVKLTLSQEQKDLLKKIVNVADDVIRKMIAHHEKLAKGLDKAEFEEDMEDMYDEVHDEWIDEVSEWDKEYEEVKEKFDDWDRDAAFDRWWEDNSHRFWDAEDEGAGSVDEEIEDISNWLLSQGQPVKSDKHNEDGDESYSYWNVFEDETGVVELASPILKIDSFPLLQKLFNHITSEEKILNDRTGLHVHIGMPENSDLFDTLAMVFLTDEKSILKFAGRNEAGLTRYAKKKEALFQQLFELEIPVNGGTYAVNDLRTLFQNIGRYQGVNFKEAFLQIGTVEFRYLTSTVLYNPNQLFEAIQYFLMLPKIAQSRTQLKHTIPGKGTIIITRKPGAMIEIKKFGVNSKIIAPQAGQPVSQLRQPEQNIPLKNRLQAKFQGKKYKPIDDFTAAFDGWNPPQPQQSIPIDNSKNVDPYEESNMNFKVWLESSSPRFTAGFAYGIDYINDLGEIEKLSIKVDKVGMSYIRGVDIRKALATRGRPIYETWRLDRIQNAQTIGAFK